MNRTSTGAVAFEHPFDDDAGRSYTMPAAYYYDRDIFEQEKSAIFYRDWCYAGHVSQVAEPGSYITTRIHQQSIFVVRTKEGELRGFYNVCQHRGHELLEGRGQVKAIVCPYHAWTYETSGELRHARNTSDLDGFQRCEFSLKSVKVEIFAGMVFVNVDPGAAPLAPRLGNLEAELRHYAPRLDDLVFAHRHSYEVESNWKVLIDNFLECYHCHTAHKDFVDLVNMPAYRSQTSGLYSSHVSDQPASAHSTAYKLAGGKLDFSFAGWFVWPNLTIWIMPGEANFLTLQMVPVGPEKTVEYLDWHLPSETPSAQCREAMTYLDEVLQPEDIGLCESVQRGMHSFGYNQGRFVADRQDSELSEHAVHHFQKMVLEALAGND